MADDEVSVTVTGDAPYLAILSTLKTATTQLAARRAVVGSSVSYARFVSDGTSRMHPNPYVETAVTATQAAVTAALDRGVAAVCNGGGAEETDKALHSAGYTLQAEIQRDAPVRSGTLRRSWHTEVIA